jgi:hypothetical protein
MKSTGTAKSARKPVTKGAKSVEAKPPAGFKHGFKTRTNDKLTGFVIIQPEEDNLIALLDAGKVEEFRRRLELSRQKRRKQMFARVLAGR